MKLTLLTLAFAVLAFLPQSFAMEDSMHKDTMAKPVIKAVAFHSDSCGSCKILGPRMKEAMNAINTNKVDVVKFDFTNEESKAKTSALAESKGLTNILQDNGQKTGWVALVNKQGTIVDKIKVDDDTEAIAAKLAKAIASAS